MAAAVDALGRGLPWRATLLLAPVLADSARRTPEAVLLAAEAAAAWRGWREVTDLLAGQSWLDSLGDGRGRRLLARAALEANRDTVALSEAHAAVAAAHRAEDRAEALVLLARALDRLAIDSSATDAYARAAADLPAIADWLRLRAAATQRDSAGRAKLYESMTLPAARNRIGWTEADAAVRAGDTLGAVRRYESLGAAPTALALRAATARDSAARAAVRDELLRLVTDRAGSGAARQAVETLDQYYPDLPAGAELTVARSAAASGPLPRAAAAFDRALGAGLGKPQDRYDYAGVLARLGRYRDAAAQYVLVKKPRPLAANAAYARARALVRDGQIEEGRAALQRIGKAFPRDTVAAATALYLLADLATDDRKDARARKLLRELGRRYPTSRFAPTARFRAALIALATGAPKSAARELDSLAARYPQNDEAVAALYWSGRAWAAAGDTAQANGRWQTVVGGDPTSYYVGASEQRLGLPIWTPLPAADTFVRVPAIDSGLARIAALGDVGMNDEMEWEYDALIKGADESVERMLATADALRARGRAVASIQLARRALARGAPADARVYRLIYPLLQNSALLTEATERGLDPTFVAALIRQESMFNPWATSVAGARGLMQLMPDVGRAVAKTLNYPTWDAVLLYQPDVNLQLGAAHLRELTGRYAAPVEVLAAYNAGISRVERWKTGLGMEDPELFAERIPYVETRDYVRIIQRNRAIYRTLYDWPVISASAGGGSGAPAAP